MSTAAVDLIARTVLYEGYLLYPYRRSAIKNQQRFNFGVLYPESYCAAHPGSDRSCLQAECPVEGDDEAAVAVQVRFLQLVERRAAGAHGGAWQEAIEREVTLESRTIAGLRAGEMRTGFEFSTPDAAAPAAAPVGGAPATASSAPVVSGEIRVTVLDAGRGCVRLAVRVANLATLDPGATRDAALLRSLASAHVVIRVTGGALVSLLDPPAARREAAAGCTNAGVWPVLVGVEGSRDCMLASPIILYDHPQIAPESAGDLFDGTEIDEILGLRILTMTDDEKREARASDDRVREILDRTDAMAPDAWAKLHGAMRGLRKLHGDAP